MTGSLVTFTTVSAPYSDCTRILNMMFMCTNMIVLGLLIYKISQESPDAAVGYAVCAQLSFLLHNLIRNPSEIPQNSDSNWKELSLILIGWAAFESAVHYSTNIHLCLLCCLATTLFHPQLFLRNYIVWRKNTVFINIITLNLLCFILWNLTKYME